MVIIGNKRQKTSKTAITVHEVDKTLITFGADVKIMRRSVTIDPILHDYIIQTRGWLGMEKRLDVDYTTVLNMLAKLGASRFGEWKKLTDKEKKLVMETLESDPEQKVASAADEWWTKHLKVAMPEYDPELSDDETQDEDKEEDEEKGKRSRA